MKRRWVTVGMFVVIVSVGVYLRSFAFYNDVDGPHTWKQAQTASNIHYFLSHGLSPYTGVFAKNEVNGAFEYRLLEFPFYQQVVAVLCHWFDTDVVPTARAVNIALYVLISLVLFLVMKELSCGLRLALVAIFLYALSPLAAFYDRAVFPDDIAVMFMYLSLLCFLWWAKQGPRRVAAYVGMVLAGLVPAVIKSPIYLPAVLAMVLWFVYRRRWRQLISPSMAGFLLGVMVVTVAVRMWTNWANVRSLSMPIWEREHFFGHIADRFNPALYLAVFDVYWRQVVPPPVFTLCALGTVLFLLERRDQDEFPVMMGLLVGALAVILLFLRLTTIHNYYHLPHVFVVCFMAAYALEWFFNHVDTMTSAYARPLKLAVRTLVMIGLAGLGLYTTRPYMLPHFVPEHYARPGAFISANTPRKAFVFYTGDDKVSWDPSWLYFARRDGYNLKISMVGSPKMRELDNRYGKKADGVYLFVSDQLHRENPSVFAGYDDQRCAYSATNGYLYRLK